MAPANGYSQTITELGTSTMPRRSVLKWRRQGRRGLGRRGRVVLARTLARCREKVRQCIVCCTSIDGCSLVELNLSAIEKEKLALREKEKGNEVS